MIERLISGYPQGDVSPQDFIDHLSMGADGWIGAWVAVGLAVISSMSAWQIVTGTGVWVLPQMSVLVTIRLDNL